MRLLPHLCMVWTVAAALASPVVALAQSAATPSQPAASQGGSNVRFRMPTVTVTAQKVEEDKQKIPVSVTAVSKDRIDTADIRVISDAALFAPNTVFTESTVRKLSNARFRGIGSSPNNPAITTYIDGVPQLNANSSSVELLDIEQIELVRGPQSALFGRNTLGGLVNISSTRPALSAWTGTLAVPVGNHGAWTVRGALSGPVVSNKVSLGVSFAQVNREGFTVNDLTGKDIDDRAAFSAKAQLLWIPASNWEARVIFSGERARDGDYALADVGALRRQPFHTARDFEGSADRDILNTTILTRRVGGPIEISTATGFVRWTTRDVTDLDYGPLPLLTRDNAEKDFQFTQEVRLSSGDAAAIALGDDARLRWQTGVFLFTQAYQQDAVNSYAPFLFVPFAVRQHTPQSELDDVGIGLFGQGTVTLRDRIDLTAGLRIDYEGKDATLRTFFEPAIAPPTTVTADESFANVSPQMAVTYRLDPDRTIYATVARGYKAGGFNAASPAGRETYGEERTWHFEGGAKALMAGGRVSANAAAFFINWDDLQLNVPSPNAPAEFFITNVGGATSTGIELEVNARPAATIDVFSTVGVTRARFSAGSQSTGLDVGGNKVPFTPDFTASAGVQMTRAWGPATLHGRADIVVHGDFQYDDGNTMGQEAYSIVNLRFGASGRRLTGELFIRNAFDTAYIPLAFPYPNLAPSGFIGEMGAPRTAGVSVGVRF